MNPCVLPVAALLSGLFGGALALPAPPNDPQAIPRSKIPLPDVLPQVTGSLAIQAIQGTPGGQPIGVAEVSVELFHRGMLIDTINTTLDEHGVTVVEGISLPMPLLPVVQVTWSDLTYQKVGATMDAEHPQQSLDVVCYEGTEAVPAWTVQMRHVMIDHAGRVAKVTEVLVVENPGDHSWIGVAGVPGTGPKRVTTTFALPEGARELSLDRGFHDWCCTTFAGGRLVNHLPLMPNVTEFKFSYVVPAVDGSATVDVVSPAPVASLMVIVPDEVSTTAASGIQLGGTESLGHRAVRYYMAAGQQAGDRVSISLAGLGNETPEIPAGTSAGVAKIVAAIGGGVLVIVTVLIVLIRSPRPAEADAMAR